MAEYFRIGELVNLASQESEERTIAPEVGDTVHDLAIELSGELTFLDSYIELADEQAIVGPNGKLVALLDAAIPRLKRAREIANRLEVSRG